MHYISSCNAQLVGQPWFMAWMHFSIKPDFLRVAKKQFCLLHAFIWKKISCDINICMNIMSILLFTFDNLMDELLTRLDKKEEYTIDNAFTLNNGNFPSKTVLAKFNKHTCKKNKTVFQKDSFSVYITLPVYSLNKFYCFKKLFLVFY